MSDYDYLNARVRAKSVSLLPSESFDQIIAAEGQDILFDLLLNSSYGATIAAMLPEGAAGGVDQITRTVERALRESVFRVIAGIRASAPEEPRRLINLQLNRWDLANIVTVLRGILRHADVGEIEGSLLPVGTYSPSRLSALARLPDASALAAGLRGSGNSFAGEIGRVIAEAISADRQRSHIVDTDATREIEAMLYQRYFGWAIRQIDTTDSNQAVLRSCLGLQVDLINVTSVLKQVAYRAQSRQTGVLPRIGGGTMRQSVLDELQAVQTLDDALETLERTHFAQAVERGVLVFGQTNRLSVLERFLEMVVINRGSRLFRADPLSLAVPLGFIWRKLNEYLNLRILLRGRRYQLPSNAIREELLLV